MLLTVVWLLASPTPRWTDQAAATRVAIDTAPVLVASLIIALATNALLADGFGSCATSLPPPGPWWASWHYFAAYGVGIVVALSGTSK